MIFDDNSRSIGRTPLVKLHRVAAGAKATVVAKIEGRNPAYSVKDRIGAAMVWDAEQRGLLGPGQGHGIIEATSGNTGIALAFAAASRGYECVLTMPETMSVERRRVLAALGARLVLTPGDAGMKGAIARAHAIMAESPGRYVLMNQFDNPANPRVHEETTGPEIWDDTGGAIDVLVAGVGTGGTITGVSRFIERTQGRPLWSIAVEPASSPVITQTLAGKSITAGAHKIQGIGAGFVPAVLNRDILDEVIAVDDEDALETARLVARTEGVLPGISGGAALWAAMAVGNRPEMKGKRIVVIVPDSGERYVSTPFFAP